MAKEPTDIDKAIVILEKTRDGDELDPKLLGLVELAANGHLNNVGKDAFEGLYLEVVKGIYKRPWFHGVEHLVIAYVGCGTSRSLHIFLARASTISAWRGTVDVFMFDGL